MKNKCAGNEYTKLTFLKDESNEKEPSCFSYCLTLADFYAYLNCFSILCLLIEHKKTNKKKKIISKGIKNILCKQQ